MAVINEIIKSVDGESLSFGDYLADGKKKFNDFELGGNLYNVRTHKLVTRLEKNGGLLIETVFGSTVHNLKEKNDCISFDIEGIENTQITMELEGEKEYKIIVDNVNVGSTKSSKSGKINFSVELCENPQCVEIEKIS